MNILLKFNKNKYHFKNIIWSNINQAILSIQFLIISIILIRLGGPNLFGQFIFLFSIFTLLFFVSISGVKEMILRSVSQGKLKTFIVATKFSFRYSFFAIPFFLLIAFFEYYYFDNSQYALALIISSIIFPFFSGLQTWQFYLKGKNEFRLLFLLNLLKVSLQLVLIFFLLNISREIYVLFGGYILLESLFNIFLFLNIKSKVSNKLIDENWKKQSFALTFMDFSSQIFGKADILIMGFFYSASVIGIYGLVMKIVEVFFLGIKSSITGVLPTFYRKGIKQSIIIVVTVLLFMVSIGGGFFVKPILGIFYGESAVIASGYIRVYLLILPIYFLSSITNNILIKYNLNRKIVFNKFIAILIVLILYLVLIPIYGIWGGVFASMVYFLIQGILNTISIKNK